MPDIYKIAAQKTIRFPSSRGELRVEDLFCLTLKRSDGFDLDSVARAVKTELDSVTQESFVEEENPDPRKDQLVIAFEIVKDVIKTKQDEASAQRVKAERIVKRMKILDAMAAKENATLSRASMKELEKKLAELDD